LIKLLEQQDPGLEVLTEGCDCYGDCSGVEVLPVEVRNNELLPAKLLIKREGSNR
jgi:hypothetical protein